jgi:hypothetical protein
MTTELALPARRTRTVRRFALTLAVAGVAALGSGTVAPAAFAADAYNGPNYVIDGPGNGPDSFIITDTGRVPIFFCDDANPNKLQNKCVSLSPTGVRF